MATIISERFHSRITSLPKSLEAVVRGFVGDGVGHALTCHVGERHVAADREREGAEDGEFRCPCMWLAFHAHWWTAILWCFLLRGCRRGCGYIRVVWIFLRTVSRTAVYLIECFLDGFRDP